MEPLWPNFQVSSLGFPAELGAPKAERLQSGQFHVAESPFQAFVRAFCARTTPGTERKLLGQRYFGEHGE